jgi:putative ABC transport system substrate-binding protein
MAMHRRALLHSLLASSLAPLTAWAQSERVYRIGIVCSGCTPETLERLKAEHQLIKPLAALGYVVGRNLRFEARALPEGDEAKSKAASEELGRAQVDVLVAFFNGGCTSLAAATSRIPIVCQLTDPVGMGFAQSLRRPGRNVTGIVTSEAGASLFSATSEAAPVFVSLYRAFQPRLNRIVDVVPLIGSRADTIGHWNTVGRSNLLFLKGVGIEHVWVPVTTLADIEQVFKGLGDPASAIVRFGPVRMDTKAIWPLAIRHRIATVAPFGDVRKGALVAHGLVHSDPAGRMATIVDRILRGANPAETPFELPDRTVLVVNRTTAKAIGANLPPEILVRATEIVD